LASAFGAAASATAEIKHTPPATTRLCLRADTVGGNQITASGAVPKIGAVHEQPNRWGYLARVAGGVLSLVVAAGAVAAIAIALGVGDREPLDLRFAGIAVEAKAAAKPAADPFAYSRARRAEFEREAALGSSHVIYEMSPGGVVASARRTEQFRDQIDSAAQAHGVDADLLEAIIFLESAGRPQVSAGPTPEAASGLAQILPETATDLLGMHVDLPASIALTDRIRKAKTERQAKRLLAERARIDDRFDPAKAIEGAARYLEIAGQRFGDPELAVESYHMGIGNLENVLRAFDPSPKRPLTYAQVYFESSPVRHRSAYEMLRSFGDESSEYLWKVLASEQILKRAREDPDGLQRTADLANNKSSLEEVFHPEDETEVFEDGGDIEDAIRRGELVPLPYRPALGWIPAHQMGELAPQLDEDPNLYRTLRPEALATLSYLAGIVKEVSGANKPLHVTSSTRSREYQDLLIASNPEATQEYSLHTTGWTFDILRDYQNDAQANAFQYALDRLSSLGLITYAFEPAAIHITVSNEGAKLIR
jgi:soluble lytic murein transglycosylase-like protein